MNATGHVTVQLRFYGSRDGKIDDDFFYFLGVALSVALNGLNMRIEVHFFVCIGKLKDTGRVYKSLRSASRFTRFTCDPCPFISQCKQ